MCQHYSKSKQMNSLEALIVANFTAFEFFKPLSHFLSAKDSKSAGSRSSTPSAAGGAQETMTDAVHRRFSREQPQGKDGVREVSRSNEIAYSEVGVCLRLVILSRYLRFT